MQENQKLETKSEIQKPVQSHLNFNPFSKSTFQRQLVPITIQKDLSCKVITKSQAIPIFTNNAVKIPSKKPFYNKVNYIVESTDVVMPHDAINQPNKKVEGRTKKQENNLPQKSKKNQFKMKKESLLPKNEKIFETKKVKRPRQRINNLREEHNKKLTRELKEKRSTIIKNFVNPLVKFISKKHKAQNMTQKLARKVLKASPDIKPIPL